MQLICYINFVLLQVLKLSANTEGYCQLSEEERSALTQNFFIIIPEFDYSTEAKYICQDNGKRKENNRNSLLFQIVELLHNTMDFF